VMSEQADAILERCCKDSQIPEIACTRCI